MRSAAYLGVPPLLRDHAALGAAHRLCHLQPKGCFHCRRSCRGRRRLDMLKQHQQQLSRIAHLACGERGSAQGLGACWREEARGRTAAAPAAPYPAQLAPRLTDLKLLAGQGVNGLAQRRGVNQGALGGARGRRRVACGGGGRRVLALDVQGSQLGKQLLGGGG